MKGGNYGNAFGLLLSNFEVVRNQLNTRNTVSEFVSCSTKRHNIMIFSKSALQILIEFYLIVACKDQKQNILAAISPTT